MGRSYGQEERRKPFSAFVLVCAASFYLSQLLPITSTIDVRTGEVVETRAAAHE